MKVIILKTNQVKEVSFGHAVNYLIPQGLAVKATEEEMQRIKNYELGNKNKKDKDNKINNKLAEKYKDKKIEIKVKAGKKGKLYGAVTKKEIAKKLGIEKQAVLLTEPIKKIGEYSLKLKLGDRKVNFKLILKEDTNNEKK